MAIASLVLGIVSIVLTLLLKGYLWIGLAAGVAGIVLGYFGQREVGKVRIAQIGLALSVVGTVIAVVKLFF